jgi:cytochrome c oxidase assembly protein Cox11
MNPKIRLILRISLVLALMFFAIKPYNSFCNLSGKCKPFFFAYIFKGSEGAKDIAVNFEVTNYIENLDFEPTESKLITVKNRINNSKIKIKNNSRYPIEFGVSLDSKPLNFLENIERFQCPCSQKYRLKGGEEKIISMIFRIKSTFYEKDMEDDDYIIRFKTFKNN